MGAAALVALIVGGPLGACLFLAYGIVHAFKIGKVDSQYAARGETPPSYALINRWLDRKKAAGKAAKSETVKPYGSRAYAKQRWAAMWEDLGDRHREVREQYKQACEKAKAEGRQPPPKPTMKETVTGWKWHLDQLDPPATAPRSPSTPGRREAGAPSETSPGVKPDGDGTVHSGTFTADILLHPDSKWAWACRTCPARGFDYTTEQVAKIAAAAHCCETRSASTPGTPAEPARPDGTREPRPEHDDTKCPRCGSYRGPGADFCGTCTGILAEDNRRANLTHAEREAEDLASIAKARAAWAPGATEPEGDTMAQAQSGEVTGIKSALHYMTTVAATHTLHGGNEQILTAMNNMKIGAGDIALVQQAREKSMNAAELWTTAATEIEKHNAGVREGYASAPDAADKQTQLAE